MSTWDEEIFTRETNQNFLDELADLDIEDLYESVEDTCRLAAADSPSADERDNGLAAATIAAIWCGAPFSYSDVAEDYDFVRANIGRCPEAVREAASEVFEAFADNEETSDYTEDFAEFSEALT